MRIGFFIWEYPPRLIGGLGTYADYMTRDLVRMGSDVAVFTTNPGNLKTSEVIHGVDVYRPIGVDASSVLRIFVGNELQSWGDQLRFFSSIFVNDILCTSKFINSLVRMQKIKFDMVCVHDWLGAMAGSIIKNELDLPVVFHVHSTEWGRSRGQGSKVVNDIEYHASMIADRIITVSYAMKEDLVNHGWPGEKIYVVWNGIDPNVYDPKKVAPQEVRDLRERYDVADDEVMALFVGRLNWVKGIINLVQAMPAVLSKHPETKLVILGTGDEEANIRELISRLNIQDNVVCRFEYVSEHERIVHYAASDLCVFPSLYEPFGIVSLEAMAMEKPVVVGARGVSGFREQVVSKEPGQTGIHVNGDNPADIAWGIDQVLSNLDSAKTWGLNARKRVIDYFTWDKSARQTLGIYEGLVRSYGKRRRDNMREKEKPSGHGRLRASQSHGKGHVSGQDTSRLKDIANRLFKPEGKNPYIFNGKPLKNLQDLKDYLVAFTGVEALWVASWIEYLGDDETAERIRRRPGDFKQIILGRYRELRRYL